MIDRPENETREAMTTTMMVVVVCVVDLGKSPLLSSLSSTLSLTEKMRKVVCLKIYGSAHDLMTKMGRKIPKSLCAEVIDLI